MNAHPNDYTQSGYPSAFVNPSDKQIGFENKLIDETSLEGLDAYFAAGAYSVRFANDGVWSDTYGANYLDLADMDKNSGIDQIDLNLLSTKIRN